MEENVTHKLTGLFYDDDTLLMVSQPNSSVRASSTAADDDNIPGDGLVATAQPSHALCHERGDETCTCTYLARTHVDRESVGSSESAH